MSQDHGGGSSQSSVLSELYNSYHKLCERYNQLNVDTRSAGTTSLSPSSGGVDASAAHSSTGVEQEPSHVDEYAAWAEELLTLFVEVEGEWIRCILPLAILIFSESYAREFWFHGSRHAELHRSFWT